MGYYGHMRYLHPFILKDLQKKMVFVGGPRQVGKTTLAEEILQQSQNTDKSGLVLNWDYELDRRQILGMKWGEEHRLLIFDEIHKYKRWKNWIKGVYDKQKTTHQFLVTGSARLDVYRRGGDSLLGRYHYWRLHPFTISELPPKMTPKEALKRLMKVGGFPEPFLDGNEDEARRWRRERIDRVLKDDIRDLEPVSDIQTLSLFLDALRQRVSSMVVLANIAQDLQVSQKTLNKWLAVLENMYLVFVLRPYGNLPRAIQKPPKVYFFDNADVDGDEGARFENMVACHLLKKIHFLEDRYGYRYELRYLRDKEKREVDFVILKDGHVEELIEAKLSDEKISPSLAYYTSLLKPAKSTQIVMNIPNAYSHGQIRVESAEKALMEPGLFSR